MPEPVGVPEEHIEAAAAHRPYELDCKCGRPINSDQDWARHLLDVLRLESEWALAPAACPTVPYVDTQRRHPNPPQPHWFHDNTPTRTVEVSRLVSGWVRVEEGN